MATTQSGPAEKFVRLGTVFAPDGDDDEAEGTINPAAARLRDGSLALYPRVVARGNVSRVRRCRSVWSGDDVRFERDGFALEPQAGYEFRTSPGGYGCEDPRVTYVASLERYLMAYCAYGPAGAQVAVAHSADGWQWTRLGVVSFRSSPHIYGDKDAAFFPGVVESPNGESSIALLHRPTLHMTVAAGRDLVPAILAMEPRERESICIAYVPVASVKADLRALLDVRETQQIMHPGAPWGDIKVGAGPPPVRVREGWLLVYHGIDLLPGHEDRERPAMQYRAGIAILDAERPDRVLYRAPQPFLSPELPEEREGVVDDVVFPTGLDPRPDLGDRQYDVYYGMGDALIGRGRLSLA